MKSQLIILDFGSQYTQLIARCVRELGVYCEILPGNIEAQKVLEKEPRVLILSGGPASVLESDSPRIDKRLLEAGLPILGICYGMQVIAQELGGEVRKWQAKEEGQREFGPARLSICKSEGIFSKIDEQEIDVWMSHGDKVVRAPEGFSVLATSPGTDFAGFFCAERKIYGVQFHPEVHHTPRGKEILSEMLFGVAGVERDWDSENFIEKTVAGIAAKAPEGDVICGLSGGVDSTVAAALVHRAIGNRLHCIFVDNGLLRRGEAEEVLSSMRGLGLQVHFVDAGKQFLSELAGVLDPEKKRKIIGRVFIEVFEAEAAKLRDVKFLVQGTLYPDVIESISVIGKSQTIKSHHNVGGLTDNMKLGLIEPLRELFKDEVRKIGLALEISEELVFRQPFPGPGLAVRCLGEITEQKLSILRVADSIVTGEIEAAGLGREIWQYFAVLLPVQSVGVMGDGRTYEQAIAIRAITSRDGMTADWYMFKEDLLKKISNRIVNETEGINRVVLDISTKPPSTIEWE